MIVEEKKAGEKICCGPDAARKMASCAGSRCMAWRWADDGYSDRDGSRKHSTTHGYCGLAGRP